MDGRRFSSPCCPQQEHDVFSLKLNGYLLYLFNILEKFLEVEAPYFLKDTVKLKNELLKAMRRISWFLKGIQLLESLRILNVLSLIVNLQFLQISDKYIIIKIIL
jgi:hypothetical protein